MSEEVIDLEANNLCITEDVFEKFQANSMYEEEAVITIPNTSLGSTTASNVVSETNRATANIVPIVTNDQIINDDLVLKSQDKEQSAPQISTIESGDDLQIQEEICVQTSNDDVEPQLIQTTDDNVEAQREICVETTANNDAGFQHIQITDLRGEPQHVQSTDEYIEAQYVQTTDDHIACQHVQTTNEHVELQFVEITNEDLGLEQPMEVDTQISNSEISINLETHIDSNTVGDLPTTTLTKFNASKAVKRRVAPKRSKRRGRKKRTPQHIINNMSIEDKMNLIHGGDDMGQLEEKKSDCTPQQQKRRGRKKNSIQVSKIDTSTDSELISNENAFQQYANDLVSSGTHLESQSFDKTPNKNEPKRRGRKKKDAQPPSTIDASKESQININENKPIVLGTLAHEPPISKSRRGRKPKNIQDSNKSWLDDSEYTIERQISDSPRKSSAKIESSDVEGYTTPQKRGRRNNVSSDEQLITLSDLELNQENSPTEIDVPLSLLSKRRGRSRKTPQEETVKEIHQSSEIESVSNFPEGETGAELFSPAKKYHGKGKKGRSKRKTIEQEESRNETEEPLTQTEMPSSTSVETVKTEISNEHTSLLEGDDIDDICLSNLRKTLDSKCNEIENVPITNDNETKTIDSEVKVTPIKRSSKMPVMSDFEYNIDNIMNEHAKPDEKEIVENIEQEKKGVPIEKMKNEIDESLLVEDSSRRPTRRRIKQNLHYDEDSDEDPFANVELSDDDEPRVKKGTRYYSDDEYIPHRKDGKRTNTTDSSSNTECELEEESKKQKRKRSYSRKDVSLSPRKKGRTNVLDNIEENVSVTIPPKEEDPIEGDIEVCLESSVIKTSEINVVIPPSTNEELKETPAWGATNEFENFIAKKIQGTALKIKKVSSDQSSVTIPPIEIPTMDAKDIRKTVEMCTQTSIVHTKTSAVQTSSFDDVPMKENVPLSKEQSVKACDFLNSIVKTTAELGVLMTQKSEDFMKKKINTSHVTDTFKMDYCVKKSFLLFKLAKRNLMQMEEDLANQYDQFLKTNNLDTYREEVKTISSKPKAESDSDCEIIEETTSKLPVQVKKKAPKFNPKTVFLNKELSIKIAKKPTEDKKLNIKGKHSVWINDSVILKKVKPTQSFLAQDSRNKKPPDCDIFTRIVNDFFRNYYREKALSICSPFVTTEWVYVGRNYICNYFVAKSEDFLTKPNFSESEEHFINSSDDRTSTSDPNVNSTVNQLKPVVSTATMTSSPKTLFSLCTHSIQKQLYLANTISIDTSKMITNFPQKAYIEPETLFRICINALNITPQQIVPIIPNNANCLKSPLSLKNVLRVDNDLKSPVSLKTISYVKVLEILTPPNRTTDLLINGNIQDTFSSELQIEEHAHTAIKVDFNDPELSYKNDLSQKSIFEENNEVKTLFSLCVKLFQRKQNSNINNVNMDKHCTPMKLKYIAYKKTIHCMYGSRVEKMDPVKDQSTINKVTSVSMVDFDKNSRKYSVENPLTVTEIDISTADIDKSPRNNSVEDDLSMTKMKTLSKICIEKIISLQSDTTSSRDTQSLTINSVNTMSEEAFLNIEETSQLENQYFDASDCENDFEPEYDIEENVHKSVSDDSNWVTQLQMAELKSEIISALSVNTEQNIQNESPIDATSDIPAMVHIKCEPSEEFLNNSVDPSIVKSEVDNNFDELVITLQDVTTKAEKEFPAAKDPIQRHDSTSYDVDAFESFVNSNKMMLATTEEIFSQSALRVRRQHEPDSDDENDLNMSLLVPHTSIPLPVDSAKNTLMESSSDDGNNKETLTKKKIDKRKKRKKVEVKPNNKDVSNTTKNKSTANNEKSMPNNEVAILTRRMRDRIRQEEKKIESSDSDNETRSLRSKTDKKKGEQALNAKQNRSIQQNEENEIQCNNVDSTEQINESNDKHVSKQKDIPDEAFTGFSAVDQHAISDYQKYIQDVYNKILPKSDSPLRSDNDIQSCSINIDDPVEYLECEPTLPIFDNEVKKKASKKKDKSVSKRKPEISDDQNKTELFEKLNAPNKLKDSEIVNELSKLEESEINKELSELKDDNILDNADIANVAEASEPQVKQFIERHGWHCYPIDSNDSKIYEHCQIHLDKLPESFVEMYFRYQDVTDKSKEDEEVDRLINLQSLNRLTFTKENVKNKMKVKVKTEPVENEGEADPSDASRAASPVSDRYDELTASEDEQENNDVELPPPVPVQSLENNLAKNSLMDDNDTDTDTAGTGANQIAGDETENKVAEKVKPKKEEVAPVAPKRRPGPKSKCKVEDVKPDNPDLMLTADKMMKEELTLLHAPIVLNDAIGTPQIKTRARNKQKTNTKHESDRSHIKAEDDSSSEEEKQWVTTKEKLLKRLEKRHDTATADDAKRAKLVNEFIERRGGAETRPKKTRRRSRKMTRKLLERQKQLSVLSKELFGESSDGVYAGKRSVTSYSKGRRNIRKVLDKKSLGRKTVLANMEEFERKRRLNIRQARLRELLGCEEGVNVLVINDELCLEYDFDEQQPVVTVHPFFTKIMKAHQYEGVKFMWDACFESLAHIAAGHPGGGCILAHCMGLGKTLQVLALLHTVMTHPGVGMHRVLVCCPLSTVLNWVDEIHKWIGPVTNQMKVFELSKLKKTYERAYQLEDWYNGGGIFIIGYELFRSLTTLDPYLDDVRPTIINKIRTALLDPGPDIIICDEGHLLKNDLSVLAVAMSRVVTKRRIVLTGTPMQNNLREYYCMVNFVKPNLLGTYAEYSNRFENPIMNGQHRDSSEEDIKLMKARTHILHKVLEGCLQRMEASVLYPYLPKKYEYTVFISLTKCQWDLYKHYLMAYGNKNKQSVLKDFHQLQKIWSHPQVLHNFHTRVRDQNAAKVKAEKLEDDLAAEDLAAGEGPDVKPPDTEVWWLPYLDGGSMLDSLDSSNKFVVVFRILDECIKLGDKVLIFSTSLFTMDALEYFLRKINKWSLGQEYYRLDGSVPAEVRQKWCREFNAENNVKTKLFLISTRAGSLGLNMTAANRVIILDTSWNPAHDIQSIFRVYRFGQKKDCYIYRLVALGTMEQKIYERSVTKQAVSCRVVDEQQIDRHYNMAELTELYRFDEEGSGVQSGVAAGVRDVALLRVARLRALHAVHEHDSLLRGSEPALPEHERQAAWVQFQYQQEHEHMQMQNELVGNVPKRQTKVAKLSNVKMLKMETDPQDPDFKPEPKKRGRKPRAQAQETNYGAPESATKQEDYMDPDIEQDKIKKIAEILVKYNFQDLQMQSMLPQLVMNVRRMVAVGQKNGSVQCDELTASIANILLERADITNTSITDIMCKSVNKSITEQNTEQFAEEPMKDTAESINDQPMEQPIEQPVEQPIEQSVEQPVERPVEQPPAKKYKPGPKCRKGYVYEEIPTTSIAQPIESEYDVRAKRRAALAAERLLETASESVIDLDDDVNYDNSDTDSLPDTVLQDLEDNPANEIQVQETPQIQPPIVENVPKIKVKRFQKQPEKTIMLSDDEEPTVQKDVVTESSEPTPLHPSLLQNANFIKIVAHTYLAGNPMLDEDAATLAARYSTYKALKEMESTGKPVASGPIYDIAVKVLGIDILRKLHKTDTKLGTNASLMLASQRPSAEQENTSKNTPKTRRLGRGASKVEKAQLAPPPPPAAPVASVASVRNVPLTMPPLVAAPRPHSVVPVGLFKTTVNMPTGGPKREAVEESILPDDQDSILPNDGDVHAVSSPPLASPSPPPPQPPPPLSSAIMTRRNVKPIVLRIGRGPRSNLTNEPVYGQPPAAPAPPPTPPPAPQPTPSPAPVAPAQPAPPPPRDYGTICLDSDDEDTPPPAPTPVGTWYTVAPKILNSAAPAPSAPPPPSAAPAPAPLRLAARRPGPASKTAMTLTGDPATIILTKNYGRPPPPLSDAMGQIAQATPGPGGGVTAKPTRLFMIPSSSVAGMNPPLIPISVGSIPTPGQPQLSLPQRHVYQHTILPDTIGATDNDESILPTPTSVLPAPTSILPTPTSILPTSTSVVSTPTSFLPGPTSGLPTPTYGAPNATPIPPIGPQQKVYRTHDIIRIGKNGQVELLSRSGEIDLETSHPASKATEIPKVAPKPASKTTEPRKIASKSASKMFEVTKDATKPTTRSSRQSLLKEQETVKGVSKPVAPAPARAPAPAPLPARAPAPTPASGPSRVSSDSSDESRPGSPADPLSILKDVIHIQADEYPASNKTAAENKTTVTPKGPNRKCYALTENSSASPGVLSSSKTATVKQITKDNVSQKPSITVTKKMLEGGKSRGSNELVVDSVDLTESSEPPPASSAVKKPDLKAKTPAPTRLSSTIPSSTKNTASVSKIIRVKTEKIVPQKTGVTSWSDSKKRPTASVDSNPPKKKKLDQLMTLEDFDIDDIDDIIELD